MKIKVRELEKAISLLKWKTGHSDWDDFNEGTVDLQVNEEDPGGGNICGSLKITVTYNTTDKYDKSEKKVIRSIEIYPDSEGRKPVITSTEIYDLLKD